MQLRWVGGERRVGYVRRVCGGDRGAAEHLAGLQVLAGVLLELALDGEQSFEGGRRVLGLSLVLGLSVGPLGG